MVTRFLEPIQTFFLLFLIPSLILTLLKAQFEDPADRLSLDVYLCNAPLDSVGVCVCLKCDESNFNPKKLLKIPKPKLLLNVT